MIIVDGSNGFELHILGRAGELDAGLQWTQIEVSVRLGSRSFRSVGPWLTTEECQKLARFLTSSRGTPAVCSLEFIEPNLSFAFDSSGELLVVSLDQEAKPDWLTAGSLSLKCSNEDRIRLANEINRELNTTLTRSATGR